MDLTILKIDFLKMKRPLVKGLLNWLDDQKISLPCLILQKDRTIASAIVSDLATQQENVMSAVIPQYHPYLFATKEHLTEELTFPFREQIGVGIRRQDFEPVYLFVPIVALIHDLKAPVKPFVKESVDNFMVSDGKER